MMTLNEKNDNCFGNNFVLYGNIKTFNNRLTNNQPLKKNYIPLKLYDCNRSYLADALMNRCRVSYIEVRAQKNDQLYKHINHCNKVRLFFLNAATIKLFLKNNVSVSYKPVMRFRLKKETKSNHYKRFKHYKRYFISKAIFDLLVKKLSKF